jgi:uncharacterized protein with GYD domain
MKLAILASATEASLEAEHAEEKRIASLYEHIEQIGGVIESGLNLLGRHDYLFVVDMPGDVDAAFQVASAMIQAGGMRTETFVGIPVSAYADIAARLSPPAPNSGTPE